MMFKYTVDICSPTHHFFASLGLCEHKFRTEKVTMNQALSKIYYDAYKPNRFPNLKVVKDNECPDSDQ